MKYNNETEIINKGLKPNPKSKNRKITKKNSTKKLKRSKTIYKKKDNTKIAKDSYFITS